MHALNLLIFNFSQRERYCFSDVFGFFLWGNSFFFFRGITWIVLDILGFVGTYKHFHGFSNKFGDNDCQDLIKL